MPVVYKYPLGRGGLTQILMPKGAYAAHVALQGPGLDPMIWAIVEPAKECEERTFMILATGQEIPEGLNRYIGSIHPDPFVFHVFEVLTS